MLIIDDYCEECFGPGTDNDPVVKAYDYVHGSSLAAHVTCITDNSNYEVMEENYEQPVITSPVSDLDKTMEFLDTWLKNLMVYTQKRVDALPMDTSIETINQLHELNGKIEGLRMARSCAKTSKMVYS